jgi:hypothetical protein
MKILGDFSASSLIIVFIFESEVPESLNFVGSTLS